ncbi:MAG: cation diffusion facilitator family transporter [bacterium]
MTEQEIADGKTAIGWAGFAVAASVTLVVIKVTAFMLTGSSAILSDALESVINIVTSGFALYAVWLSAQPRDMEHPYGHGKIEYLSAAVEGALVTVAGIAILLISAYRIAHPPELESLEVGGLLTLVSVVVSLGAGMALVKAGRRLESPSLEADGVHLRSDAVTSIGALVGVGLVFLTGHVVMDAVVAMVLSVWLMVDGGRVVRRAIGGILDEASPELLSQIGQTLEEAREPGWSSPHHTKVHRLGQAIHIDLHMVFPRFWSLELTHDATVKLERAIRARFGQRTELMIHMEACRPDACKECDLEECPIRTSPFLQRPAWDGESIRRTRRHDGEVHE